MRARSEDVLEAERGRSIDKNAGMSLLRARPGQSVPKMVTVRLDEKIGLSGPPQRSSFRRRIRVGVFFGAPGRAHSLGGESPLHTRQGEVFARDKGFAGHCEFEGSRGKTLA